ncbi:MAG TPA: DUF6412 domain-containing protein [Mycobacteriales bacterium]|nr:DUF6412 domain-containing protein [Mycobacteriales bacterium]
MIRFGHLAARALAAAALLAVVLAGGQSGLVGTVSVTAALVLVATAVVAGSVLGSVLVPACACQPGGGAARALGALVPLPRQCEPDAPGRALPRAPGGTVSR